MFKIFRNIVCLRVQRERRTSLCSAKSCMILQTAYVMVNSSGLRTGSRRKKTKEFDWKDWLFLRLLFICGANTSRLRYYTLHHHIHGGDTHHRTPPMASAAASSCSLLRLPPSSFPLSRRRDATSTSRRRTVFPAVASVADPREEEIVIVGAGIAGLATALSLHRLGIRSVVLEQGDSLRAGGTSLTLFKNGWRVLDSIGVADELRGQFLQIQGLVMRADDGRELRSFVLEEETPGQEARAVERRVLLETLASPLPPNTISFSSRLKSIRKDGSHGSLLELEDGDSIRAKIVIGCDGVRSPVAKWMGFSEPRYVGHCAFRGLAVYPEGHSHKAKVNYIYGRGIRAGFLPISSTKVYWFICWNSVSPGPKIKDPSVLKQEALNLVRSWPEELLDVIQNTSEDVVIKTPLVDRWLWPILTPSASSNGVVVVGDAWHPMTPNLGQGACCALEDSVVLVKKLATAIRSGRHSAVDEALQDYSRERWARIFPLTVRSNITGSLLQWDDPLVCAFRNNVMVPRLVSLGPMLEHTNFECEMLEQSVTSV
ncbi:monooxygenase 3-like isoform X1 [Zingiber officinale]|uniref:monooxygenase 3-like isoform X1 n=2 Tax=Zingiber officinale TaxID=94328 RepID=UPI001C4C71B0|nr:monooxygenase 3-like isoform X1 [Zingiber officinale]